MVPSVVMNGLTPSLAMMRPLARPTAAPAAIPASTPAAIPNFTIVIAAIHPAKAAVEPTERSKPPPTMTKVMPMAITAMIDDCTRILVRLNGERKRLVSKAVAAQRTINETSGICPARFQRLPLAFISAADGVAQLRLIDAGAAIERGRDASLPHSENAVAQPRKLGEIAGIDHCAGAAGDEIGEERMDL